jgi:hypothetical protein
MVLMLALSQLAAMFELNILRLPGMFGHTPQKIGKCDFEIFIGSSKTIRFRRFM